jgi:hypothetical protein
MLPFITIRGRNGTMGEGDLCREEEEEEEEEEVVVVVVVVAAAEGTRELMSKIKIRPVQEVRRRSRGKRQTRRRNK